MKGEIEATFCTKTDTRLRENAGGNCAHECEQLAREKRRKGCFTASVSRGCEREWRTRRSESGTTACHVACRGGVWWLMWLEHTWEKRALDWSLLRAGSGPTALAAGGKAMVKGLGAGEEDVSEVVFAVDVMVGACCGRYRGGGGRGGRGQGRGGDQGWGGNTDGERVSARGEDAFLDDA